SVRGMEFPDSRPERGRGANVAIAGLKQLWPLMVVVVALIAVWEIIYRSGLFNTAIRPSPLHPWASLRHHIADRTIGRAVVPGIRGRPAARVGVRVARADGRRADPGRRERAGPVAPELGSEPGYAAAVRRHDRDRLHRDGRGPAGVRRARPPVAFEARPAGRI